MVDEFNKHFVHLNICMEKIRLGTFETIVQKKIE
jgi:hypothetical protein